MKKPATFSLEEGTVRKLQKLAKTTRRPKSTLVDMAVELLFNKEQSSQSTQIAEPHSSSDQH
jgi:predicted transcriptional regulator